MLSNTSTLYLVDLCDKYPDNKYVVVEWRDLACVNTNPNENFDLAEVWNELKMNGCLINKYKDEEEVCFTLTDKSRVLVQEYKLLTEQMAKQAEDKSGDQLAESYIKTRLEVKKLKKSAMGRGFLGGLLSGGICGLLFGLLGGIIVNLFM